MAAVEGNLFFPNGLELWRSDGTPQGTSLLVDLSSGAEGPGLVEFLGAGGSLYFVRQPSELWRSDGTPLGTALVSRLNAGLGDRGLEKLSALGSRVLFVRNTTELWISDGSSPGTIRLKDFGKSYPFDRPSPIGGKAFFQVGTQEVWVTDGTPLGTGMLLHLPPGSSNAFDFEGVDGSVVFSARSVRTPLLHGCSELWRTDGTAGGTSLLKAFLTESAWCPGIFQGLKDLTAFEDRLFRGTVRDLGPGRKVEEDGCDQEGVMSSHAAPFGETPDRSILPRKGASVYGKARGGYDWRLATTRSTSGRKGATDSLKVNALEIALTAASVFGFLTLGSPPAPWALTLEASRRILLSAPYRRVLLGLLLLLAFNLVETNLDFAISARLPWDATRWIHAVEGDAAAFFQRATSRVATAAFALVYLILLPALPIASMLIAAAEYRIRFFRNMAVAVAVNYAVCFPFYLLFPVQEAWSGNPAQVRCLLDDLSPVILESYRAMSALDNCFPSFHTSLAVTSAAFASRLGRPLFGAAAWLTALGVALSTLYLGIHWVLDVGAGVVLGAVVSWCLVPRGGAPAHAACR